MIKSEGEGPEPGERKEFYQRQNAIRNEKK